MAKPSNRTGGKGGGHKKPSTSPRHSNEVRPLNILIVDDDPSDRLIVRRALKRTKLDPKITEASDLASAFALIRSTPFHAVLLDHLLPDGKSIDLLRKLRGANIRLPVIVTTGYGDEMLAADLLKTGAADYLPKDRISEDTVSRAISHAIRVYRMEEDKLKKDQLLEASAEAFLLLNTRPDNLSILSGALGIIGKALGVDRLTAFEQSLHTTTKYPAINQRFEWSHDAEDFKFNDPRLQNVAYQSLGLARWHALISSGHPIGCAVRSLPAEEQSFFASRGVISLLALPVMVEGRCWGFVLIEDRHTERTWTDREKSMLTSVATTIGSALMHHRADEALRQSEEQFRNIVENQTDCICCFLPDGTVTFVNEACCRYCGCTSEQLIGRPFINLIAKEDQENLLDQLTALRPDQPFVTSENRSMSLDGTLRWGQWTNRAFFNSQGQLIGFQGVGRDITARKRMEFALQASESRYRNLVEKIPAITYTAGLDVASTTLYISPQVEPLLGYTQIDYKKDPDLWRKLIHPEDRDRVMSEITKAHQEGHPFASEYRMIAKDGRIVWFLDQSSLLRDHTGIPILMQGVMYDISDRKRAENELQNALSRSRALEIVINQGPAIAFLWRNAEHGPIDFVSDNIQAFGFTAKELMSGKIRRDDIVHADDLPRLEKEIAEHLRKGHATCTQEYRMLTRNGAARWVEDRTNVIRNAEGQITHFQSVVWDVTDRRESELALQKSREYLDKIINTISDPVFVKDSQHRFVLVNDAECALIGTPRETMIGKTDMDFFPQDQVDVFWKYDEQVLKTGKENINEEIVSDVYDRVHVIVTKKSRYTDPAGNHYIVGVIRDITDRKKAEDELRRSEEQWRAQYKNFPIPTFTWTFARDEFILTDFNDAGMAFTNQKIKEYQGYTVTEFHKDRPDIIDDIHRCMKDQSTIHREYDLHFHGVDIVKHLAVTYVFVPPNQVMVHTEDITERQRAEQALRASEEKYRSLINNLSVGIFRTTIAPQFGYVQVNPAHARILAYDSVDELMAVPVPQLFDPAEYNALTEEVRRNGSVRNQELHLKKKDGSQVTVSLSAQAKRNNRGEIDWVDGFIEDITERKRAEEALRQSEAQYRTLAEASPDMIFMCAPNSNIIYTNSLGARQWKLKPDQFVWKKQEELFPPEVAERHRKTIRHVCETKQPYFSEVTEMLKESKVWIETRLVPIINAAGDVTAILGVSRDISDRRRMEEALRESEANFRALADNALDGIVIITSDDARFVYANKALLDMYKYSAAEMIGQEIWEMMPGKKDPLKKFLKRSLVGNPDLPKRYEGIARQKDGSHFPIDVSVARTQWKGRPAILTITRDISLQKKLEEERTRLATNLLEIQENERREISSMLHDHLGQLLTLTRLELGSVGTYDANSIKSINNAIARLDEALGAVRQLAVSLRPPILDDLGIEVALETLTEEFADSSTIQTSFTRTGPDAQLDDAKETCLYRVLQEALTNAVKHSKATRIDVALRTSDNEVCLEICDNGQGFDMEMQKKRGSIGFIGMRERLARCAGLLTIHSELGKGTMIRAVIPETNQERLP